MFKFNFDLNESDEEIDASNATESTRVQEEESVGSYSIPLKWKTLNTYIHTHTHTHNIHHNSHNGIK